MSAYIVVEVNVKDAVTYERYKLGPPEYAAAKALRMSCTDTDMVVIDGVQGVA